MFYIISLRKNTTKQKMKVYKTFLLSNYGILIQCMCNSRYFLYPEMQPNKIKRLNSLATEKFKKYITVKWVKIFSF